jgi:methylenetetrahydrofolate reductase (NADPH)
MKIIDKINKANEDDTHLYSFEYFPPKTEDGVANLYRRLQSMAALSPAFIDVTWGAGGSTSERTLEIVSNAQKYFGLETMMHLTCTNMPLESIHDALVKAKESGIQNILALRGDPPRGEEWKKIDGGFAYAEDLVKYIKAQFGDYFGIAVAGYPETHTDSKSKEEDLFYLKKKIDAGGDFIITQLFFDTKIFLEFVEDCRKIGITCPIIPGIMPIHTYAGFKRMVSLCGTFVPQFILDALEEVKDNDEAVKEFGVKLAVQMCQELVAKGIKGLHFYTLNLERTVVQIVEGLGLSKESPRPLPWRLSGGHKRVNEDVRPVFWSNRQQSYIKRTESWDEFPNGRWGDSRSPAFGELTDFHLGGVTSALSAKDKKWKIDIKSIDDVQSLFVKYCKQEIDELPWNDLPLSLESEKIKTWLLQLNSNGYLTINSQPCVNGAPSSDPVHGWGGNDGWVYQKAYVEFFVSESKLNELLIELVNFKQLTYHAVNMSVSSLTHSLSSGK